MDSNILVVSEGQAGLEFLTALRRTGFPMQAAFWKHLEGREHWRLYIVTPLIDLSGILPAHYELQQRLNELRQNGEDFGLSMLDIGLLSPHSEEAKRLGRRYGLVQFGAPSVKRIDLANDEAYVYFNEIELDMVGANA